MCIRNQNTLRRRYRLTSRNLKTIPLKMQRLGLMMTSPIGLMMKMQMLIQTIRTIRIYYCYYTGSCSHHRCLPRWRLEPPRPLKREDHSSTA